MRLTWLSPSPVQVWAVEPGAAQLTWGFLPRGEVTVLPAGHEPVSTIHPGGAGALVLSGLASGPLELEVRSIEGVTRLETVIPEPPSGAELCRVATISDLHLGSGNWGALRTVRDNRPKATDRYDMRCATAAVAEAVEWGASLLVIKGDAAHHRRDRDFELVGELVDRFPKLPMIMIPGNHDVDDETEIDLPATVGRRGLPFEMGVRVHDLSGVRLIVGNTTIDFENNGTVEPIRDDLVDAAGQSPTQNLLFLHHQFQEYPWPTYWPPGISSKEAKPFLSDLASAAPRTLVSSGHTHRNRTRRSGPLLVTEIGSTKDWPGSWGGYRVFEGGIYQTVRRVAGAEAIDWTEYSRRALLGLWSPWSPGDLRDRCAAL